MGYVIKVFPCGCSIETEMQSGKVLRVDTCETHAADPVVQGRLRQLAETVEYLAEPLPPTLGISTGDGAAIKEVLSHNEQG